MDLRIRENGPLRAIFTRGRILMKAQTGVAPPVWVGAGAGGGSYPARLR